MAIQFGAILPIIGPPEKVRALTQEISQTVKAAKVKITVDDQGPIYDHGERSFKELHHHTVIYTASDAYRYSDFKEKLAQYKSNIEVFFNRLFQAVGEPVSERDFRGRGYEYEADFNQYSDKVKAWVAQNPWPVYPNETDFIFNLEKKYHNGFNIEHPGSKTFQNVDDVASQIREGRIDLLS